MYQLMVMMAEFYIHLKLTENNNKYQPVFSSFKLRFHNWKVQNHNNNAQMMNKALCGNVLIRFELNCHGKRKKKLIQMILMKILGLNVFKN